MKCHVTQHIKETEGNTRIFLGSGWSYKSNGFMNSGKYQHVFTDPTSKLHSAGDMVAIMEVLVRPPSESCNILVNLLSLFVQEGSNHQKIIRSAYKGHPSAPSNKMVWSFQSEEETTTTPQKERKMNLEIKGENRSLALFSNQCKHAEQMLQYSICTYFLPGLLASEQAL